MNAALRLLLCELEPGFVCVRIDLRNAYNECDRAVLLRRLLDVPQLAHLTPFIHALSGPRHSTTQTRRGLIPVYTSHTRAAHVPTVGKTKTHANNVAAEARSLSTQGVAAREAPARAAIAYSEATSRTTPMCRAAELRVCRGARERGMSPGWKPADGVPWSPRRMAHGHGAGDENRLSRCWRATRRRAPWSANSIDANSHPHFVNYFFARNTG